MSEELDFKTTEEIPVPERLIDQVIGQDHAVEIIKLAAKERRHVLLIGEPGTGKSMLGRALAELLPTTELEDILVFPNEKDPFHPIIKTVKAGEGRKIVEEYKRKIFMSLQRERSDFFIILLFLMFGISFLFDIFIRTETNPIIAAARIIVSNLWLMFLMFFVALYFSLRRAHPMFNPVKLYEKVPKVLVDNSNRKTAPFVDATGLHEGALLGDVLHDPFQSGGLGTPPHQRVVCLLPDTKMIINNKEVEVGKFIDSIIEGEMKEVEGFYTIGFDEEKKEIVNTKILYAFRRKYYGKCLKIKTEKGFEVKVTPDHPFAVVEKNEIIWKLAKDLYIGDEVLVFDGRELIKDKVSDIIEFEYSGFVYNFTTETENYIANGILLHNCGAIHRAHKGVLYIDEIATLKPEMQVELLTAMQEKKYPITGRSERSAGAMVQTDPVPCDFILVAAGTPETIKYMHPALRSRIRGYGYEVYMNSEMPDTPENRKKLARFVAQEVKKRGLLHFTRDAVIEIIKEARKMARRKGYLTLRLRELGGLVQAASDIAKKKGKKYVEAEDVIEARKLFRPLEKQMVEKAVDILKEYQIVINEGEIVGRVNGLAVIAFPDRPEWSAGIVLPIEAVVTPSMEKGKGRIIATGRLGNIAKEAIQNVSAIVKKISDIDLSNFDIHIQFISQSEGVEGESASISVATAVISALFNIPVRQDTAMTGSLSIRGEVLPVGGINEKIEAAFAAGIKRVIIPKVNLNDITLPKNILEKIEIIPVENIAEVLENALVLNDKAKEIINRIRKEFE